MSLKYAAIAAIATLTIAACGTATADEPEAAPTPTPTATPTETVDPKDRDGDGVNNGIDYDPDDPNVSEWPDTDGDGFKDNSDDFPEDPMRHDERDRDGDGVMNDDDFDPDNPDVQEAPPLTREDFSALDEREWALITKDPDSHVGERVIVYGYVTQFDFNTGTDSFRANSGAVQYHEDWYEYDTNTFFDGTEAQFENVVQDDLVKVWGTVSGSYSYSTTIGGTALATTVDVEFIEVYGQR